MRELQRVCVQPTEFADGLCVVVKDRSQVHLQGFQHEPVQEQGATDEKPREKMGVQNTRRSDLNTLGSPLASQVDTSRWMLGRQVWNLEAGAEPKIEMGESSVLIFRARDQLRSPQEGVWKAKPQAGLQGSVMSNYQITITIL